MSLSNFSPKVSVCIANYNGEHVIENCLNSVLQQTYENVEIIVHDDHSLDNSIELLEQYSEQIELINSETNRGYCKSNNKMISVAKGDYILLLNNDTKLASDAIEKLVSEHNSKAFRILTLRQCEYDSEITVDHGCVTDIFLTPLGVRRTDLRVNEITFSHGACLFFDKNLVDCIGLFPESLDSLAEDLYFCLSARSKGYRVGCLNTTMYHHMGGHSFGGGSPKNGKLVTSMNRRYLSERNRLAIMRNNYPILAKLLLLPAITLLLLEAIVLGIKSRSVTIVKNVYFYAIIDSFKINLGREWILNYSTLFSMCWLPSKLRLLILYGLPKYDNE